MDSLFGGSDFFIGLVEVTCYYSFILKMVSLSFAVLCLILFGLPNMFSYVLNEGMFALFCVHCLSWDLCLSMFTFIAHVFVCMRFVCIESLSSGTEDLISDQFYFFEGAIPDSNPEKACALSCRAAQSHCSPNHVVMPRAASCFVAHNTWLCGCWLMQSKSRAGVNNLGVSTGSPIGATSVLFLDDVFVLCFARFVSQVDVNRRGFSESRQVVPGKWHMYVI